MRPFTILITFILLIGVLPVTAQNRQAQARAARNPRPAVSAEALALYEPSEFKGLKYRLMKPIDFDSSKTSPFKVSNSQVNRMK